MRYVRATLTQHAKQLFCPTNAPLIPLLHPSCSPFEPERTIQRDPYPTCDGERKEGRLDAEDDQSAGYKDGVKQQPIQQRCWMCWSRYYRQLV